MTVRFKCVSEYQKSYRLPRSRSVSPQRSASLAGVRLDRTGLRQRCGSTLPARSQLFPVAPPAGPWSRSAQQEVSSLEPEPPTPPGSPPGSPPGGAEKPRPSADSQPRGRTFDGQEPLTNGVQRALRLKAGLRSGGERSGGERSEYHREFSWKKPAAAASPTQSAQQVLYSSCWAAPPSPKKYPVTMDTEYRRSFLGLAPPTRPRLRKHLEHQRAPLFHTHTSNRRRREEPDGKPHPQQEVPSSQKEDVMSQSPQKATPTPQAHGGHRKLTEYQSSFRSPLLYRILDGGRVTESPTQQDSDLGGSLWFSELQQRRRQASLYRSRAWGLHFSRAHLSQLLSEHNALWEPADTTDPPSPRLTADQPNARSTSCVEALDLASSCSSSSRRTSVRGAGDAHTQHTHTNTHTHPAPPAERRLAWGEEEETDEEEGRLPTPKRKIQPFQRTHHDRTTPATGGALLVGRTQRGGMAVSMATEAETAGDPPLRRGEAWPENSPAHNYSPDPSPNHKPAAGPPSKPIRLKQHPPTPPPLAPPLPHRIHGTLRHPDFQHNGELGLRFRELRCSGGACGSDEDDRLSVMSLRSATSCSVASAVLERAQKRRDNFWGKT